MRVAIYARISLDKEKRREKVETQLAGCHELAVELGAESVTEYVDNSVSAFSGVTRPQFEKLLDHLEAGRYDALLCYRTDRLYRRLTDLARLMKVAKDVRIETCRSGGIDLSTALGRTTANIFASIAEGESDTHAERRRDANKARRAAGAWRKEGSRPFGFNGDGTHRQPEAAMIQEAVKDLLTGGTLHGVARRWNTSGISTVRGKRWSNLHVRRVLSNPRLAGLVVHKGEVVGPGAWDPIVEEAQWKALQALFKTRAHAMAFERRHLLSGIALCGACGRPLYGAYPHGRDRPASYICKSPGKGHVARAVAPLDDLIEGLVVDYLTSQGVERDLLTAPDTTISALEERRSALTATRSSFARLLREGVMTEDDVRTDATAIQREIDEIDQKIADRRPALVLLDGELLDRWENGSVEAKSAIVDMLLFVVVQRDPQRDPRREFDASLVWHRWR